jgi:hypothetical protein
MKLIAKPVEMVAHTNEKGEIRPYRFRVKLDEEPEKVIKVDKVIFKQTEKLAGNPMILYKCQSLDGEEVRYFDLKYELNTCRWILFRM